MAERISWAPKVKRAAIWQIYQNDALGAVDDELVLSAGLGLLARCRSILLVSHQQVACPRCEAVFSVREPNGDGLIGCPTPGCGWTATPEQYHLSWRHQDLNGANILADCQTFADRFPEARTTAQRMFLIDRLIHAFHWDMRARLPNRSAANNLIQGSHAEVLEMLDRLAAVGDPQEKQAWRTTVEQMLRRRRGG